MKSVTSFNFEEIKGYRFGRNPFGKPNLLVYIYFIDGLLIDTGQRNMQKEVMQSLNHLPVKQIFVTHHHEDHSGNIAALQKQFSCPVYSSTLCAEIMKAPPKISFAQKTIWGAREPFSTLIIKKEEIYTEHFRFKIIPIPGHAPDMVALYEPNKKWLFSADLFINTYIGYFLHNESIVDQINSIKTILALDFEVMFCAHKPVLENGKTKLKKKLDYLISFYEQVVDLHLGGVSPKRIFKKLRLKESWFIQLTSGGKLSKINMVKSVIQDFKEGKEIIS